MAESPSRVDETIGDRVRRLRVEQGLSQRALSAPGVSYAYVSRIEAGKRNPSLKAIRTLAAKLGVTPGYLETGARIAPDVELELRLADSELELRLGRDLNRAAETLRGILDEEPTGPSAARARAALGVLASRRGDHAGAVRELERAIDTGDVTPERRSDAYETLATAYVAAGSTNKAVTLLERCLEHVAAHASDDVTLSVRYRTFLATTYATIGQLDRARDLLVQTIDQADGYAIPSARVVLYWSLARVAWMQNDSTEALLYVARAIGLLEASDDSLQLARAHILYAQISNLEGRSDDAGTHLEHADRLLALGGDRDDVGILRAEQAKHAAKSGDAERGLMLAREAVDALENDLRHAPTAWHALAVAQHASGDLEGAEMGFERAVSRFTELKHWREAASTARDWAGALREAGREGEAYELLERALFLELREAGTAAQPS